MLGKINKDPQLEIFKIPLWESLGEENPLIFAAGKINWSKLDKDLSIYYSPDKGRPGIPIRKIAGMIILKKIFQINNRQLMDLWFNDPAVQYFCGELYLSATRPFAPGEISRFRRRVGEEGIKKIDTGMKVLSNSDIHRLRKYLERKKQKTENKRSFWNYIRKKFFL